jgi:hypothetical protein
MRVKVEIICHLGRHMLMYHITELSISEREMMKCIFDRVPKTCA